VLRKLISQSITGNGNLLPRCKFFGEEKRINNTRFNNIDSYISFSRRPDKIEMKFIFPI
jgi:hypothetical protein